MSNRKKVAFLLLIIVPSIFSLYKLCFFVIGELTRTHFESPINSIIDPMKMKVITPEIAEKIAKKTISSVDIVWSNYAYVNYVSSPQYLCNAYAQLRTLLGFGTKAKFVLLVTPDSINEKKVEAIKKLSPNQVIIKEVDQYSINSDESRWVNSLVKLEVFRLSEFERIIYLDNDGLIHQTFDELFLLPSYIEFAAPVSYWESSVEYPREIHSSIWELIEKGYDISRVLPDLTIDDFEYPKQITDFWLKKGSCSARWTSMVMVIKPSEHMFQEIVNAAKEGPGNYDMEYVNAHFDFKKVFAQQKAKYMIERERYRPSVVALSLEYGILSFHIRSHPFFIEIGGEGNSPAVFDKFKYIHVSEHPNPKPMDADFLGDISCNVLPEYDFICPYWYSLYIEHSELSSGCKYL